MHYGRLRWHTLVLVLLSISIHAVQDEDMCDVCMLIKACRNWHINRSIWRVDDNQKGTLFISIDISQRGDTPFFYNNFNKTKSSVC